MTAVAAVPVFDLTGPLPTGRTVIEASAGTGKTYSISGLVVRYLAEEAVSIDQLLVVTFTRAAASELRDRIRSSLRLAADHLGGAPLPPDELWMSALTGPDGRGEDRRAERLARLRRAVNRFDEATISTIHGFGQQALAQFGVRCGVEPGATLVERDRELVLEVCRDHLIGHLVDDPLAMSPPTANGTAMPPDAVERHLAATVSAVVTNAGAASEPPPGFGGLAGEWAAFVGAATAEVERRRRARHEMSYDQLIGDLHRALTDASGGSALAAQLAERFPLVLVDEFQDTDRLQWEVFDRAFGAGRLIIVGDPKQAIYRFRGADLPAYLEAVRGSAAVSLATNFRSDRRLLRAVGTLFDGAALGHPEVRFTTVEPAPDAVESALHDGAAAALHIRVVPNDGSLPEAANGTLKTPPARRLILADVASRVHHLLSEGRLRRGTDDELERAVLPGDVAVLVPSQRLAGMVTAELRRWRIPAVRSRTGSVFDSDAAEQWRALLAAVAAPNDPRLVRAAALGWFGGHLPAEVLVDRTLAESTERWAELAAVMRGRGVADFWEALRGDAIARLVGAADGDRNIADADQIAELLVAATHGDVSDPHRVRELLDELVGDPEPAEAAMRRVESDADAVTVTTVHSAKGLEYPIVLVPFPFAVPRRERPYTFTRGTRRVVDVASWVPWIGPEGATGATSDERKELSHHEVDGDQLRLLYVAVTRARHRVELWWANVTSAPRSAFGRILADREAGGPVRNQLGPDATAAMVRRSIDAVAAASGGAIAVHDVPLVIEPRPLASAPTVTDALAVPALGARTALRDPAWRAWSFTAIARRVAEGRFEPLVGGPDPDAVTWPADDDPEQGGADEPAADIPPSGDDAAPVSMPLADVAGGTTFGTMVHRVLEVVDFTDPLLGNALAAEVEAAARRAGLEVDPAPIAAGLAAAIATPLGSLFDGHALGDLAATDRLTELTFDLALGDDAAPPIDAADIGRLMAATLPPGDPLAPFAPTLANELDGVTLRGWLTGSIDAVFRLPCADVHRYVLVDYKSNRLHRPDDALPLDAYRGARLVEAMVHSHYPLQALLYAVALHRFLAVRLGAAYRPDVHLGGVAYLFLRGMVGDATAGVFSWQPPVALVTGLDRLFAGGTR